MSEAVLYQYPGDDEVPSVSPPAAKVRLALQLLEVPHRVVMLRSPLAVRRVSATGRVPVLELDGRRVVDSVRILDLLEERAGLGRLSPRDPAARARDRAWEHFANDHLYWLLVYFRWVAPGAAERTAAAMFGRRPSLARTLTRLLGAREAGRRARGQGVGLLPPDEVEELFARALDLAVEGLAGGPFLEGRATPGRGDLAVTTALVQAGWRDTMPRALGALRGRPALVEHLRRTLDACGTAAPAWSASG